MRSNAAKYESTSVSLKAGSKEIHLLMSNGIADMEVEPGVTEAEGARVWASSSRAVTALKLAYLGWAYQGFAVQDNTDNTVEARLFEALLKTRLIQDRQSSNYHRCGRTDKGVSAFSQVITIDLRSSQFCGGLGVTLPENLDLGTKSKASTSELPYVKMLNRVLPQDIRILDWAAAEQGFSARFDCQSRTYRYYYFPRGSLDVELMGNAAKRYEGTHDFRNLCKMDVGNGVLQFERTILSASVRPLQPQQVSSTEQYDLFVFEIKGLAFLYHQVRCMMAVLLLIGQKLEALEIINQLLDVEKTPRKPQYSMAVDYPLVLYDCHFDGLTWQQEAEEVSHVLSSLQRHWTQSAVKAQVLLGMIRGLEERGEEFCGLCLSAGLGTPRGSPGRARRSGWGEGSLGLPSEAYNFFRTPLSPRLEPALACRSGLVHFG
uniref:Pseudouridylate synthase 3 n=1 Tax=Xiphophorus maculatus TaxID=8083 RepID=A0A3B5R8T6_XIPMA